MLGRIKRLDRLRTVLDELETLDVTDEVAELATAPFRLDRHENRAGGRRAIDKRSFDTFHFATAVTYGIELASEDAGMRSLRRLHAGLPASAAP